MLSVLTIIAVPIALYYSNRTEVSVIRPAVACIDSPPHDYVLAHKELLNYLDSQKFVRIENPGWQTVDGGLQLNADRTTWLLVNRDGGKCYLEIKSSELGFLVDVWLRNLKLRHQTTIREERLCKQVRDDLANWWTTWKTQNNNRGKQCDEHEAAGARSNEVSADSFAILSAPTISASPAARLSRTLSGLTKHAP